MKVYRQELEMTECNSFNHDPSKAEEEKDAYIGGIVVSAFFISMVGDWFFEIQWSNPYWYLFEFCVWGSAILLTCLSNSNLIYRPDPKRPKFLFVMGGGHSPFCVSMPAWITIDVGSIYVRLMECTEARPES